MTKRRVLQLVSRETKALVRLSPWVAAVLVVLALLWRTDLAAVPDMFQSSPVEPSPPPASATPTEQPPDVPTATSPPGEATVTDGPTQEPGVPTATDAPVPVDTPTLPVGVTPSPTVPPPPTATATLAVPTLTPLPPPTSAITPLPSPTEPQRYPDSDSQLSFDFGMLFDSVALGVSYLWLCCGVLLLLAIPVVFAVLWLASRSRKQGPQ